MTTDNKSIDTGQQKPSLELRGDGVDNAPHMSEGERLKRLLEATRYEQKALADAMGLTRAAVGRWTKLDRFSPKVWDKIRSGLLALGLNPGDIRAEDDVPKQPIEDLTRLVENWTRVQLSMLKRILESDDTSREILLAYINGSLRQIP